MSARGARSRKAVAKNIEKKEKKAIEKGKAIDNVRRPHDAFAEWPPSSSLSSSNTGAPSRSVTISSDASRATSRSSSTNPGYRSRLNTIHSNDSFDFKSLHRRRTSMTDSASIGSGNSSKGKDKKYQSKTGKETKAPRGRGGGVPVKKSAVPPPPPIFLRSESSAARVPPNQKTWIDFRIWEGGEAGFPPYGGWDCDEHMQTGNVLVYFKEEQQSEDKPVPQIRCDFDVLESSGSTWLSNALLYGRIDEDEDEWTMAGSPESSHPNRGLPQAQEYRRMLAPTDPGGRSPPPFTIDQAYFGVPANGTASRAQYYADMDHPHYGQSPPPFEQSQREQRPTHELWFTAPAHVKTPQAQRLHHVAIRNFLAMLHDKPIVGSDLFDMLNTLQPEIQVMYDLDQDSQSRTPRERSVQMIINYLSRRHLDDIRNSIKTALALLAWSEQDNIKWRQGYLESFVHLAGVLSPQMEELPDFKRLSIVTRRNLAIAAKSLQLRVMEAEEKLSSFDFGDFWADNVKVVGGPVHQSYQAFRHFLVHYFTRTYGNWPPTASKTWLNRKIVLALQKEFGALYDYLVNRDVVWDSREERPGKKWQMVNPRDEDFRADFPDLSLGDLLVTFDNKLGYLHVPHPYPLLPREVAQAKTATKKSFFSGLKRKEKGDVNKDAKAHLQASIVFSDATNIEKMDGGFDGSPLIDAFERFELTAFDSTTTSTTSSPLTSKSPPSPREARLGRWILLYGILQVLSTLSVDVRDLKWTQGVRYFLCTDLKRCPEWVTQGPSGLEWLEAGQERSWCWQRPWGAAGAGGKGRPPAELEGREVRDVSVGLGGVDFEGELGYAGAGAGTLSPPRAPQLAPVRSPSSEQISPSAGMSSPGGGGGGATLLNEDIRRISEKIHDMHMSSRPRGHSPRGHSPYGQSPQGRSPQTMSPQALSPHSPHSPHTGILPPNRLYERRIENEKLKREDLGRMDDSFRLTQSDYVFQRGIGLDRGYELDRGHGVGGNGMGNGNGGVAPVLPLRSPHRRPSAASGGNGSPGTGYGGNGNGNGGGYMQAQGNGSGNGNGHGGQQGVRGWNEEAAGWV